MKRKTGIILGIIVIIALIATGIAVIMGYVYGGIKVPDQRVVVHYNVCDDKVADKINDSIYSPDKLRQVVRDIEKKNHYLDDATCVATVYFYYATNNDLGRDTQKVNELYNKMKSLSDKGIYASGKLIISTNVEQLGNLRNKQTLPRNKQ